MDLIGTNRSLPRPVRRERAGERVRLNFEWRPSNPSTLSPTLSPTLSLRTGRGSLVGAAFSLFVGLLAFSTITHADALDAVRSQIKSAQPGAVIEIPSGSWSDAQVVFDSTGSQEHPITLRAAEPGKAVFTGTSRIEINGKHLVVDGVLFSGKTEARQPPIEFGPDSADCRLTNSAVVDFAAENDRRFQYVRVGGSGHRVDHCLFTGKTNRAPVIAAEHGQHVTIDHNHFRDIPHFTENGHEIVQIVGIGSNDEPLEAGGAYWLVEENLFERAHGEGSEIVSIKSNHNVIRHNTIRATKGALTMRSGGGNTFDGNLIFGDGMNGAAGLRISGRNAKATNNYITGVSGTAMRLHAGEYIAKDISGSYEPLARRGAPLGRVAHYLQMIDAVVSNNLAVDCTGTDLDYGGGYGAAWPKQQRILLPDNLTFANNVFVSRATKREGPMVKLVSPDEKAAKLPEDAKPRPIAARGNFFFGAETGREASDFFAARVEDPKLIDAGNGMTIPSPDSAAVASGFDPAPFSKLRPLAAADVGPSWVR